MSTSITNHVAYMLEEERRRLREIIYEKHTQTTGAYYEIFWYSWPRDGVLPWEDFEPVTFVYNTRGKLCVAYLRCGWKPIILEPEEIVWPPEVLFKTENHHQFLRKKDDDDPDFGQEKLANLAKLNVDLSSVRPVRSGRDVIPAFNIEGNTFMRLTGLTEDIYFDIEECKQRSCEH